nr:MAG TPA: hypothetical protein [Caudoviricetes sp.]
MVITFPKNLSALNRLIRGCQKLIPKRYQFLITYLSKLRLNQSLFISFRVVGQSSKQIALNFEYKLKPLFFQPLYSYISSLLGCKFCTPFNI